MTDADTLTIQAYIDRDFDTESGWLARVMGDVPYHGLFATGEDFKDARKNLARVVYEAAKAHAAPDEPPKAVRVLALTRKTFEADALVGGEE